MVELFNDDCLVKLKDIPDESVDSIVTDPPYLYLRNQKLDRTFDETVFFQEVKRVLKPNGFIVLFGRGTSFYRWNTILANLGFTFKEEVIWNKRYTTSPFSAISRVHETVSIHTKGDGTLNKGVKIPYTQSKQYDYQSLVNDVKRIKTALNNPKSLSDLLNYLETSRVNYDEPGTIKYGVCHSQKLDCDRAVTPLKSITEGSLVKSIIDTGRDHFTSIHPTQKPVELLKQLIRLVSNEGDLILDPFSGSCSTGVACIELDRNFIGVEIDEEYYNLAKNRIDTLLSAPKLF